MKLKIYRRLKEMGVREIFSGTPSEDDLGKILHSHKQTKRRETGIDPRKCVYVWSACGGAGGTAVALSIAKKFAKDNLRTLFIDMDLFTAPACFMLNSEKGARETTGLVDALSNPGRVDSLFLERVIDVAGPNLFYLSARKKGVESEPKSEAVQALISRAQQSFDMVVVDIPWRCYPNVDPLYVQGHSYVVTTPTANGLIGFLTKMKELSNAPGKFPTFGVMNKEGEFKVNDIEARHFNVIDNLRMLSIPYDQAASKMFFEQKTFIELGGKFGKAMNEIFATLPGNRDENRGRNNQKKQMLLGLFGKGDW